MFMPSRWQIKQGTVPYPLFFGAGIISAAVLIWLAWATWASSELASKAITQSVEFEQIIGGNYLS